MRTELNLLKSSGNSTDFNASVKFLRKYVDSIDALSHHHLQQKLMLRFAVNQIKINCIRVIYKQTVLTTHATSRFEFMLDSVGCLAHNVAPVYLIQCFAHTQTHTRTYRKQDISASCAPERKPPHEGVVAVVVVVTRTSHRMALHRYASHRTTSRGIHYTYVGVCVYASTYTKSIEPKYCAEQIT